MCLCVSVSLGPIERASLHLLVSYRTITVCKNLISWTSIHYVRCCQPQQLSVEPHLFLYVNHR